jgi:hypothetical protein
VGQVSANLSPSGEGQLPSVTVLVRFVGLYQFSPGCCIQGIHKNNWLISLIVLILFHFIFVAVWLDLCLTAATLLAKSYVRM